MVIAMKKHSIMRFMAVVCSFAAVGAVVLSGSIADAEPQIDSAQPRSTFDIAASPQEGRDPFFPSSLRPWPVPTVNTNQASGPVVIELKGISGTAERPLALINNQTLMEGETSQVSTHRGRATVKCIKIQGMTVRIEVNGKPRELKLRDDIYDLMIADQQVPE